MRAREGVRSEPIAGYSTVRARKPSSSAHGARVVAAYLACFDCFTAEPNPDETKSYILYGFRRVDKRFNSFINELAGQWSRPCRACSVRVCHAGGRLGLLVVLCACRRGTLDSTSPVESSASESIVQADNFCWFGSPSEDPLGAVPCLTMAAGLAAQHRWSRIQC